MGFSDAFELQKKEGNQWKDLKITAEFEFGGGPIYSLAQNVPDPVFGFATFVTDFTYLYDELKPGTYRVIKGGELSEDRFYSNEFTINKQINFYVRINYMWDEFYTQSIRAHPIIVFKVYKNKL